MYFFLEIVDFGIKECYLVFLWLGLSFVGCGRLILVDIEVYCCEYFWEYYRVLGSGWNLGKFVCVYNCLIVCVFL